MGSVSEERGSATAGRRAAAGRGPNGATGDGSSGGRGVRVRDGLVYCLKVFLGVRIALFIVATIGVALLPSLRAVSVPGWPGAATTPGWHNLFTAWERFDGLWFLQIAAHGYAAHDGSAAFFPLYPLAIRWLSFAIGGHPYAAALIVSNVAMFVSLLLLYALSRREFDQDIARRSVLYLAVFPTSFFLFAPYSESLFLMLVLACFWWMRRGRWELAGLAGALAALTRNLGVLLVLPMLVEALELSRPSGRRAWVPVAWSLAPIAGAVAYLGYWQARIGDWLAPVHQQATWQRVGQNPLVTLWHATYDAYRFAGIYAGGYHQLDWLIAVPVLAAAVYVAIRMRPSYGVYVWASILAPLSFVFLPRPLMSFPRFALPLFPVYWALARWTKGRPVAQQLVLAGSGILLGTMLLLFVNWYYIF
jgi:hypothetical protein